MRCTYKRIIRVLLMGFAIMGTLLVLNYRASYKSDKNDSGKFHVFYLFFIFSSSSGIGDR